MKGAIQILLPKQKNPPKPNLSQPPHQSLKILVLQKPQEPKFMGSVKEKSQGEGTVVHQQLQKDKVSEAMEHQPSHSVPSQKVQRLIRKLTHP